MKTILLLLACIPLTACTVGPIATAKGVSMGGSMMTKTEGYYAEYEGPFGKIKVGNSKSDETGVPKAAITGYTALGLGKQLLSATRAKESTTRILAKEQTAQKATASAADVEKTRILNPVEEPPAVIPSNPTMDPDTGLNIP